MNNNFFFYEVIQKEKFEQMRKESEQARLIHQLSNKIEASQGDRVNIREKIAELKSRLALEVKSFNWSLR